MSVTDGQKKPSSVPPGERRPFASTVGSSPCYTYPAASPINFFYWLNKTGGFIWGLVGYTARPAEWIPRPINRQKKLTGCGNRIDGCGCPTSSTPQAFSHDRNRLKCPQWQCPPPRSSSQCSPRRARRSAPLSRQPSPPPSSPPRRRRRRHPSPPQPQWTSPTARRCRRTRSWTRTSATRASTRRSSPTSPPPPTSGSRRRRQGVR